MVTKRRGSSRKMTLPSAASGSAYCAQNYQNASSETYVVTGPSSSLPIQASAGTINGYAVINKFGRSTDVDNGVDTDVWDRANAASQQVVWVAPLATRKHNITSTSNDDDAASIGAKTIQVYGLPTWDTAEVSEVISLDGTTAVETVNSYVIIHRMKVLTWGSTGPNVGVISATALTDGSITAQILALKGQTLMAIYGVPSTQCLYLTNYYASFNTLVASAARIDVEFCVNPIPDVITTACLVKNTQAVISVGSSSFQHNWLPYYKVAGPAIIRIHGTGSANGLSLSAGFDGYLVDN